MGVLDNLGADVNLILKKLKSPGGIVVSLVNPFRSSPQAHGVKEIFYYVWSDDQLPTLAGKLDVLANFIDAGRFKTFVDETYDLDHFKDAYHRLFTHVKARIGIVPGTK